MPSVPASLPLPGSKCAAPNAEVAGLLGAQREALEDVPYHLAPFPCIHEEFARRVRVTTASLRGRDVEYPPHFDEPPDRFQDWPVVAPKLDLEVAGGVVAAPSPLGSAASPALHEA